MFFRLLRAKPNLHAQPSEYPRRAVLLQSRVLSAEWSAADRFTERSQHFRGHGYRTAAFGKVHTPDRSTDWLSSHCDLIDDCYSYYGDFGGDRGISPQYAPYPRNMSLLEKEDSARLSEFAGDQQHEGSPSNLPYRHAVEGWTVSEIHNSPAHRLPNFRAMAESPRTHEWLIELDTFDAGYRRVWRAYLACSTQVDYALGEFVSYLPRYCVSEHRG
jgi:arylsulfatase A-like enzyme